MPVRRTIERTLQDGDDRQTQRSWHLQRDGDNIVVRRMEGCEFLFSLRPEDVPLLCGDLAEIAKGLQ